MGLRHSIIVVVIKIDWSLILTMLAKTVRIRNEMETLLVVVSVLWGMAVGSFLNVCIDRLPQKSASLVSPPSYCPNCHRRLAIRDLVPVFSYLWLRGRCRYCRTPVSQRLLWVEAGTGILFGYLYWHFGLSIELAIMVFYCCLFVILMVIDLEHGLILNKIVYPAIAVALIISIFLPPSRVIYTGETASMLIDAFLPRMGIVQAAIGGSVGLGLFSVIVLVSNGGMGWGDVKMAGLMGVVTGYLILVAILLAIVVGGLIAGILLLVKKKKRKESIPFGPFLSLGTIATLLWGGIILDFYLRVF